MERIDELKYLEPENDSTREKKETFYLTGPAEFLCKTISETLKLVPQWRKLFGEFIDPYKRMDYAARNLPAMRIYNNDYSKDAESWFINGDIIIDIIFPANLRRVELEQLPDTVSAALMQQFRRPEYFATISEVTPGLNELGKTFSVDKSLAFEWGETLVPLTQVRLNFRMDLRAWDDYMESDNRTKDQPFERPLGDLERIVASIQALRDDEEIEITLSSDQIV